MLYHSSPGIRSSMPDPVHSSDVWLVTIARHPTQWSSTVKAHLARHKEVPDAAFGAMRAGGVDGPQDMIRCDQCDRLFAGTQAYRSHCTRKHGLVSRFRSRLLSTECLSCQRDFHTPHRIHKHIAYDSTRCRSAYCTAPEVHPDKAEAFWRKQTTSDSKSLRCPPVKRGHLDKDASMDLPQLTVAAPRVARDFGGQRARRGSVDPKE